MRKLRNILLVCCLLCAALTIGSLVAFAEVGSSAPSQEVSNSGKKNFYYNPDISIEWGEYSENNIPDAVKGVPYRVFSAYAEDAYSDEVGVSTKVYLHYLEDAKSLITLKNNCVTPKYYGVYTVEYTAVDMFGNKSVYTYDFNCKDDAELSVSLVGQVPSSAIAGIVTPIAPFTYSNAKGSVSSIITATHNGGKEVLNLTGETSFIPMYSGEYTIEYELSDFSVTTSASYTVTVDKNSNAVFMGDAAMPKYFIVGRAYTLPSVDAKTFPTGTPVSVTPKISVKYGNERATDLTGFDFTPEKAGELTFTYSAMSAVKVYKAQAIDVGEPGTTFDITKFFYAGDVAKFTAERKLMRIQTATEGATVEFINALPSRNFSINLNAYKNSNFSTLNIFIKDSVDPNVQLKISYVDPRTDNSRVIINDDEIYKTKDFEYDTQTFTYSEESNMMDFNTDVLIDLPDGFAGFPSGLINVSLSFENVTGTAELELYRINNQTITNAKSDGFAPQLWLEVSSRETYRINEVVSLGNIYFGDVLDPSSEVYVSVLSPNGDVVDSTEGKPLKDFKYVGNISDFDFRVTEYGDYYISFTVKDSTGNKKTYGYTIDVKDIVPPTATLVSDMPDSVKAGSGFKLSDIIVSDDVSAPENCNVTVILIGGQYGDVKTLEAGHSYTFNSKGTYYLYYIVADEEFNTVVLCHKFIVE